jgi:hypothetical protein
MSAGRAKAMADVFHVFLLLVILILILLLPCSGEEWEQD